MLAFHNDAAVKEQYLDQVRRHYAFNQIVKEQYWEKGKGCAVGCTIHGDDYKAYEDKLGIPQQLAGLEDKIFEGLPYDEAMEFPFLFLEAIPLGADLSLVWPQFAHWLLLDEVHGVIRFAHDMTRPCILTVAALCERVCNGETVRVQLFENAAEAAIESVACIAYNERT